MLKSGPYPRVDRPKSGGLGQVSLTNGASRNSASQTYGSAPAAASMQAIPPSALSLGLTSMRRLTP